MHDLGYFAHRSPSTGVATDRLQKQGVRHTRVLENIAISTSASEAFDQWMQSPSHRANILDGDIDAFGLGVSTAQAEEKLYATLVLTRMPDDEGLSELSRRAKRHIDSLRRKKGMPRLSIDHRLSRIARRHSREMAGRGELKPSSPIHGNLVDSVFRELDVTSAAADVFLTDAIEAVGHSNHATQGFKIAGVGIHRAPHAKGPQLWVTVIYATP